MPETRIEKAVFVLGMLAIAGLGFLVVHLWHHTHGATAPRPATSSPATTATTPQQANTVVTTTDIRSTSPARTETTNHTRPPKTTTTVAGVVALLVTAKTDTWLEIRSGSATGPLLYSGTLAAASAKTFRARTLWARFGAAGNLSARLNGKSIALPAGTYSAIFDGHGFRQIGA